MNPAIQQLSTLGHGVFTTREARARGLTSFDLVRLVKSGVLDHPARGVYAVPHPGPEHPTRRHLRLAAGVCRLYPDAVLTHHSAALALGLPVWGSDLSTVMLARSVTRERIAQHWMIRPRPEWLGRVPGSVGPSAAVAPTVVQHALESGAVPGIVAADFALHERLVSIAELQELSRRVSGWPRSHHVATMLAHMDGRSESPGESRLRVDLAMAGIAVEPQVVIRDEVGTFVARVDFVVRGTKVIIEFDGLVKYREGGSEALVAEKRREDELRRLGYVIVRVIWAELAQPAKVLARVRAAMTTSLRNVDLRTG